MLGGRVAEALVLGDISMGASNDIERATEIARKIQEEMVYPGQVKITVIRETRSVAFAK